MHKHNLQAAALLLVALLAALSAIASCDAAVRLQLVHTDAGRGLSRLELLQRMAARTKARAARFLTGNSASAPVTPGEIQPAPAPSGVVPGIPDTEYLVHLGIGTPPQPVQLTLDTGSDLVWTQCQPCTVVSCFPQSLPYFDPSLSSTFAQLPCDSQCLAVELSINSQWCTPGSGQACSYSYGYGDNSTTTGLLEADTFTFPGDTTTTVPGLLFGCGTNNSGIFTSNETGIAGFGRGNLSLPSQLNADNFSYCFTDITGTAPSPVLLGLPANLFSGGGDVQTTPLIDGPQSLPSSFYFVSLTAISVGSTSVPVSTGGSTFVDSGTGMTSLPQGVYAAVVDAFVQQVSLSVHNSTYIEQLCFTVPAPGDKPDVPKLMLQFDGATLDLPRESYMFEVEDNGVSLTCLALNNAGAASEIIIIGNYQQQNLHVLYDLANNSLSFVPAQCDQV